jgi:phosphoribosylformylglycinamidine cyclo-ligase
MPGAYQQVGVLPTGDMRSFASALEILRGTFAFPRLGAPTTDFGFYASVLQLTADLGLAISTDGVGTKLLVAQAAGKFDTVGIDLVAMNANDIICVGAEPIAMVDYVAVESSDSDQLREIALGLREGARQARISIPGGETAQVAEMLHHDPHGRAFDLVGTCVGTVPMDRVILGQDVAPGDAVIGFSSSGIHSNGLTLARNVFLSHAEWSLDRHVAEFGRSLAEELLEPTRIYVALAMDLLESTTIHALAHITSDGLMNLNRVAADNVAFDIDYLPAAPPVFDLLSKLGHVEDAEMYAVYNMGIGLCAVLPEADGEPALALGRQHGLEAWRLGTVTRAEVKSVRLRPLGLEGIGLSGFQPI